jgi:hypothetical protein
MQKKLTQKLTQKLISFILFIYIFCFALIPVGIQQEAKAGDIYLLEIKGQGAGGVCREAVIRGER